MGEGQTVAAGVMWTWAKKSGELQLPRRMKAFYTFEGGKINRKTNLQCVHEKLQEPRFSSFFPHGQWVDAVLSRVIIKHTARTSASGLAYHDNTSLKERDGESE
jgi:hypothetical protein